MTKYKEYIYENNENYEKERVRKERERLKKNLSENFTILKSLHNEELNKLVKKLEEVLYEKNSEYRVMFFKNFGKCIKNYEILKKINNVLFEEIKNEEEAITMEDKRNEIENFKEESKVKIKKILRGMEECEAEKKLIEKIKFITSWILQTLSESEEKIEIKKTDIFNICEINAIGDIFLNFITQIVNYYICIPNLKNKMGVEILTDEKRKIILDELIKNFKKEKEEIILFSKKNTENEKLKNEEIIKRLFEEFYSLEYFDDRELQKKNYQIVKTEKIEKYNAVNKEEFFEYLKIKCGLKEITNKEMKMKITDYTQKRADNFKKQYEQIEEIIDVLNEDYKRNLDKKNYKNIKAIYHEVYLSELKFRVSRRTARQIILNKLKNRKKEKTVKFLEIEKEEDKFLNEKITRAMFLVEGMSNVEYQCSREIMWEILESYKIILKIINRQAKNNALKNYIIKISEIMISIVVKYGLEEIQPIHFTKTIKNIETAKNIVTIV